MLRDLWAMNGKICVVTGANSGIGKETAIGLARKGATVIAVCRDKSRGEAAVAEIKAASGTPNVSLMLCDLSSQASIRAFAAELKASHPRIDVLVNNAGAIMPKRVLSEDGIELTFALNHLGYFLLTNLLLDTLKASAPSRIINVSSAASRTSKIDFSDLENRRYSSMRAYGRSKLANVLFTTALARRLAGTGVTVNALHPGVVSTNFGKEWLSGPLGRLMSKLISLVMIGAAEGAETSVYLASAPEVAGVSGEYFAKKEPATMNPQARDPKAQEQLWEASARLVKL